MQPAGSKMVRYSSTTGDEGDADESGARGTGIMLAYTYLSDKVAGTGFHGAT